MTRRFTLPKLVVATHNRGKAGEIRGMLGRFGVEILSAADLGLASPPETGQTFEDNATIKALAATRASGLPALADDSGIEVDALGGRPGVHTRRYAGPSATDADNNARLLRELDGLPADRRAARYVCVLTLAVPDEAARGRVRLTSRRGTCRGRIATAPRGAGGFGYDPIFEPAPEPAGGRTFGEYSAPEKHAISHRARAARRMARVLVEGSGLR